MSKNQNNDLSPNPAVMNDLLNVAAKKLGCTPQQLQKSIESGNIGQGIAQNSKNAASINELNRLMKDPAAIQKLMNDPKAAELLKKLSGK